MAVDQYEPAKAVVLHAALWRGVMSELAEMPNLNELVNKILSIDSDGILLMTDDETDMETMVKPNQSYIVRGITGHFFVVEKEEFEKTYRKIPKVMSERRRDG